MLVVARKFNDIFYAMSTLEWKMSDRHDLLILSFGMKKDDFPFLDLFDRVYYISVPNNILHSIYSVINIRKYLKNARYNYVVTGNVAIVANLYILHYLRGSNVIMIEDGLMNYVDFKSSRRLAKRLYEFVLGINEEKIVSSIIKTYLLLPDEAVYYYGSTSKLHIDKDFILKHHSIRDDLQSKRIFVGQPFYKDGLISVDEYVSLVNSLIEKHKIDYYLPHVDEPHTDRIKCKLLDLSRSKLTLELYASIYDFELYSFTSSVLYSTKCINHNIKTFAFKCDFDSDDISSHFLFKHVNAILNP